MIMSEPPSIPSSLRQFEYRSSMIQTALPSNKMTETKLGTDSLLTLKGVILTKNNSYVTRELRLKRKLGRELLDEFFEALLRYIM